MFIPDDLEQGKVVQTAVYDQTLVAVQGTYDDVNRLCSEIAENEDWAFVNVNVRPYYAEGSKTLGYEVAEQLGWRIPPQVVIPMASGSLLTKVDKAFGELTKLGLVDESPWKVYGAQATGCSPIATAFENGWDAVKPVKPSTIARSLAIGNPADGPYALDAVRRTGGAMGHVSDEQVVAGIRLLASTEGLFAETAGGVTVATLKQLLERGADRPRRRDRPLQHRRRAQDPRRGRRARSGPGRRSRRPTPRSRRPASPTPSYGLGVRTACLLLAAALAVAGCSSSDEPPTAAPRPPPTSGCRGVLDGVELELEVADTPEERAVGLMRRESVPPGTGMVFLYDEPSTGRYYMFDVPIPLRAIFVSDGAVVSTVVMPPCELEVASACPTYGADGPYDTVVETAPETLPDVQPGDAFELRS